MTVLDFRVLGPVEVRVDGQVVPLGYAKQRCVLALLVFDIGHIVAVERIVDRVWGSDPPESALNVLYGHIARLRRALLTTGHCTGTLRRAPGGYLIDGPSAAVDLHRFRALVRQAGALDDRAALPLLREALGVWRGPALAGVDGPWAERTRSALQRERLAARLALCEARLRLGLHEGLVSDLTELAGEDPLHEGVAFTLMLALYRSGHIATALKHFAEVRHRLVEELGTDPGAELSALHQQVLRRDPALDHSALGQSALARWVQDNGDIAKTDDEKVITTTY